MAAGKKPSRSSTSRIVVPGVLPARKRGGARSSEPVPVKKRKLSQSSHNDADSPSSSKRARVIKAVLAARKRREEEPLFLPDETNEDEGFPEDGLDRGDDDEGSIDEQEDTDDDELVDFDQDLVDFITKDYDEEDGDEDEDDDEYQFGQDGDILDDDQDFSGDDLDEVVEPSRAKRSSLVLTSSTSTHLQTRRATSTAPHTPARAAGEDRPAAPSPGYTPYVNHVNPKDPSKPRASQQSPATRNIVKRAAQLYRARTVTDHAFPDDETRVKLAAKFIIQAANELGALRRVNRFKADPTYQDNTVKIVKRSDTQVRGEIVAAARELIGPAYGLGPGRGSAEENKTYVELLMANGNFLYRELVTQEVDGRTIIVTKRAGPYRQPIVGTLIQQEFFNGHEQMAIADLTTNLFNPVPLPVIAIAATAVQCALRDWSSGVRVKSASEFTSDEWSTVYIAHLRELTRMLGHKPREVDAWTRKLWRDCWSTTSQFLSGGSTDTSFITDGEMDDFADVLED